MSSRSKGKVTHHYSAYNPCEHCLNLKEHRDKWTELNSEARMNGYKYYSETSAF